MYLTSIFFFFLHHFIMICKNAILVLWIRMKVCFDFTQWINYVPWRFQHWYLLTCIVGRILLKGDNITLIQQVQWPKWTVWVKAVGSNQTCYFWFYDAGNQFNMHSLWNVVYPDIVAFVSLWNCWICDTLYLCI